MIYVRRVIKMIDEKEVYKVMVYIQDRMITLNEALLDYNRYNDKIPIKVCYDENIRELKIIKNKLKEIIKNVQT